MSNFSRMHDDYLDPDKHLWPDYDDNEDGPGWSHDTDPYGNLTWCIGSEDDFWCFDFATSDDGLAIRLHAAINSETGSFIMNAENPSEVRLEAAVDEAQRLTDAAMDWCGENEVEVDREGWNTEENDFVQAVRAEVKRLIPPEDQP